MKQWILAIDKLVRFVPKLVRFLFEPLPGVPSQYIYRRGRLRDIYHDSKPPSPASVAQRRCLGSFANEWDDECGRPFCKVCDKSVDLVSNYDQGGHFNGMIVGVHHCDALRQCGNCDSGIWDEHYLCDQCREGELSELNDL